ncbi:MAG: hypothetical protein P8J14_02645 [Emcibacteraceae bacterium]|nr:hypothetical protein [Emcibacteraceae bacterium]
MQYLVVVWKYELNKSNFEYEYDRKVNNSNVRYGVKRRMINFGFVGFFGGLCGFWIIPMFFDSYINQNLIGFSVTGYIFIFWVFINIHHYFIDNVIWRKENKDVGKYLFI